MTTSELSAIRHEPINAREEAALAEVVDWAASLLDRARSHLTAGASPIAAVERALREAPFEQVTAAAYVGLVAALLMPERKEAPTELAN